MKGNFIIVSYDFYPLNSGGSHRTYRLAKYLNSDGWRVIVITTNHNKNKDFSLVGKIDEAAFEIIKIEPRRENLYTRISKGYYFNVMDDLFDRWEFAIQKVLVELSKSLNINVLFISCPPFSLTKLLKKKYISELAAIKVLDMRDAWSYWNIYPYASRIHYWFTLVEERRALQQADIITVTSPVTLDDFISLHSSITTERFFYMPNSFEYLIEEIEGASVVQPGDKLTMGYVGSFYYNPQSENFKIKPWYKKNIRHWWQYVPIEEDWKYRSPYFVFLTVAALLQCYPRYRNRIEINLAGDIPAWLTEMINEFGIGEVVQCYGRLNKSEIPHFVKSQDMMLITSAKREHRKDYSIAGKTFEYFSFLKPILAFVTEGAQKDILEKSGLAVIINPDLPELAIQKLKDIIDYGWRPQLNYDYINRFSDHNVFGAFTAKLQKVISDSSAQNK